MMNGLLISHGWSGQWQLAISHFRGHDHICMELPQTNLTSMFNFGLFILTFFFILLGKNWPKGAWTPWSLLTAIFCFSFWRFFSRVRFVNFVITRWALYFRDDDDGWIHSGHRCEQPKYHRGEFEALGFDFLSEARHHKALNSHCHINFESRHLELHILTHDILLISTTINKT